MQWIRPILKNNYSCKTVSAFTEIHVLLVVKHVPFSNVGLCRPRYGSINLPGKSVKLTTKKLNCKLLMSKQYQNANSNIQI